jgi:DNA-binding transcriptional MerR regulator
MAERIDGKTYYRTIEVCQIAGISRSTLFRWLKEGVISAPTVRDWRGWRLFTKAQAEQIKARTQLIVTPGDGKMPCPRD